MKKFFCINLLILINFIFVFGQGGNTSLVGRWAAGPPYAFIVENNIVYTASGGILQILDISNPSEPQLLGQISTSGIISDVAKEGNYVYLAEEDSGLIIINVSNLSDPVQVGEMLLPGPVKKLIANSQFLYVAEGEYYDGTQWLGGGLRILDVANPSNPQLLGFYDSIDSPNYLSLIGQYVYIDQYVEYPKTFIILVSNPAQPVSVGFFPHRFGNAVLSGNLLYVATQSYEAEGLKIVNVSYPMYPTLVSQTVFPGGAKDLTINDNYAFLTNGDYWNGNRWIEGRIWSFDISEPNSPIELAFYDSPGHVASLSVDGNTLIINEGVYSSSSTSEEGCGLRFLDATIPSSLQPIGFYATPGWGESVTVRDNYAFVLTRFGGMSIVDLQSIADPIQIGYYNSPGSPQQVVLQNNYAYLADGWSGFRVIDISDLTNPFEVGSFETGEFFNKVDIRGDYIYTLSNTEGLLILDISNPANIVEVSSIGIGVTPLSILVEGNLLYLSEGSATHWGTTGWIKIIDVSEPDNPVQIGEYYAGGGLYEDVFYPRDMALKDNYLYVVSDFVGLRVFDVSDPTNLIVISDTPTFVENIEVEGNYAYVTHFSGDIMIFDISDPFNLAEISLYERQFYVTDIAVDHGEIYASAFDYGMMILRNDITTNVDEEKEIIPVEFALNQNYPNPFNPNTVISYQLPVSGNVSLKVYDILGNEVATLVSEDKLAGNYEIDFNGSDLASGVYLYVLRYNNKMLSKKMMLLK